MKLPSKRNAVTLNNGRIVKRFADTQCFQRELEAVTFLKSAGVRVPEIIRAGERVIEYAYINGDTYLNLVERFDKKHAKALLSWLESYYKACGTQRGDVNLRNFIYCEGQCIGIDFEDTTLPGDRESDFGRIIAFAATYEPPFTKQKQSCARLLLDCFKSAGADENKVRTAYENEIKDIIARRGDRQYDLNEAISFWGKL